jgi:hypothetical protein
LYDWQGHNEGSALPRAAACRNSPTVPIDYFATDGETYSGPLVFTLLVQALENREDAIQVLLIKPDAVILY